MRLSYKGRYSTVVAHILKLYNVLNSQYRNMITMLITAAIGKKHRSYELPNIDYEYT